MKKALFSLLLAIACMPMAFGQNKAGSLVITDTTVCSEFLWTIDSIVYYRDTTVMYQKPSDSIHTYVLNLTVRSNNYDTLDARQITGNCFASWNGKTWETPGEYFDTIKITGQCDSIVKIQVVLNGPDTTWTTGVACDSLIFHSNALKTSGDFFHLDAATATTDCHVQGIHLTIVNSMRDTASVVVQDTMGGCRITWLGNTYSFEDVDSVIYGMGKTNVANCDSLMAIRITSFDSIQHDTTYVENCGKYRWTIDGQTINCDSTGIYTHTTTSSNCTENQYLNLAITAKYDTIIGQGCESYTYTFIARAGIAGATEHATFTESGIYDADTAGIPLYSTQYSTRCITYHTLKLTIDTVEIRNRDYIDTAVACDAYKFSFSNIERTLTESVDTTLVRHVRYGDFCYDSIGRVIVTIKHKSYQNYNVTYCDSYFWPFTGETYTASTTKEVILDSVKNAEGCDSIGRLNLTINYTPEVSIVGNWHLNPDSTNTAILKVSDNPDDHNTYKWFKNNEATPFSTSDSVSVTVNTNTDIRLESTSRKGCIANNWITITYTLGIDDVDGLNVNLYPNPASRILNVENAEGINQVTVYNVIGQQVIVLRDVNANATQLNLGALANGTYTLQVRTLNGKQATRKFIVNK